MNDDLKPELREQRKDHEVERRRRALVTELRRPPPRRRPPWARRALVVIPIAGALAAGAYAVTRDSQEPASYVGCYPAATQAATATADANPEAGDPAAQCRRAWARGDVNGKRERPPALVACQDGGEIRVYPGDRATCGRLGLERVAPDYAGRATRDQRMRANIKRRLAPCVSAKAARRIVREELARAGHRDWAVTGPEEFFAGSDGRRCVGSFGDGTMDSEGKTISHSIDLFYGSIDSPRAGDPPEAVDRSDDPRANATVCRLARADTPLGAYSQVACDGDPTRERCADPRRVTVRLRAALGDRDLRTPVRLDVNAAGRCFATIVSLGKGGREITTLDPTDQPIAFRVTSRPR